MIHGKQARALQLLSECDGATTWKAFGRRYRAALSKLVEKGLANRRLDGRYAITFGGLKALKQQIF